MTLPRHHVSYRRARSGLVGSLLWGTGYLIPACWGMPASAESLAIVARVEPGTIFVGQAVSIRVEVAGAGSHLAITPPASEDFDLRSRDRASALASNAEPSSAVRNFVAIPRRSGALEIPPFRGRSGAQAASSRPLRLTVLRLPGGGRTSNFLGGVGPFEVRSEVEPASVRVGQTLEFRILLDGPAAWASSRSPDLSAWEKQVGVRAESLPAGEPEGDGPSRTFRYRIRTIRGGKLTLPPVAVAAFEPETRRYTTRTTRSLAVVVEPPVTFDPSSLDYGDEVGSNRADGLARSLWLGVVSLGLLVAATSAMIWRGVARARARRLVGTRAAIDALLARLGPMAGEADLAQQITAGFAELLETALGRPRGVLTPPEAGAAVRRLSRDESAGIRAEALIADCDRAAYGRDGPGSTGLIAEARAVLEEIRGRLPSRKARGAEGGSRDRIV